MKLKTLLFLFLWASIVSAQTPGVIDYLIITEYRGDNPTNSYLELTNVGTVPVQLNQFKLGHIGGGHTLDYVTGKTGTNSPAYPIPVDTLLQPGASFLMASDMQHTVNSWLKFLPGNEKVVADNIRERAGLLVLNTDPLWAVWDSQWGGNGFILRQIIKDELGNVVDSLVVDQVGGTYTGEGGQNPDRQSPLSHYSVAGVENAVRTARLIRKAWVTKGNLDFNTARGTGLEDSEWIAIPFVGGAFRLAPWTIAEHGDYTLNANTLESDHINVDFANKKLTVPWGVVRGDAIMSYFEQKPNIVWNYEMAGDADSLSHAAQTGDKLHIYVVGNTLYTEVFDIVVTPPSESANMLVARSVADPDGFWRGNIPSGVMGWPRITTHASGVDTIWGVRGGIPYATRVDSLLVRLDKPGNATWEIVYKSGVAKPDLIHGDKIKVKAQNGSEKEYFISVNPYFPSSNARLSAIQWPDIPEFYRGLFGWKGDTIPGFNSTVLSYNVEVPLLADGIPAFDAKTWNLNSNVEVERAKNLTGSIEDRTFKFTVTAEDTIAVNTYSIVLRKEQDFENLQPNHADPFITERVRNWHWSGTDFVELVNPGNQPLDLSNYMIASGGTTNPADMIATTHETNWLARYDKYIPGYKWAGNEAEWAVQPYLAQRDLSVDAIVYPGETFTMGAVKFGVCDLPEWYPGYHVNVQFANSNVDAPLECNRFFNHWGEQIGGTFIDKWHTATLYLYKILNDSVQNGLKPATDPNDFELIDVIGKADGSLWTIGTTGLNNPFSIIRKPHVHKGNPVPGAVLGTTPEDSEVLVRNSPYFGSLGFGWPQTMYNIINDIGIHFMDAPTQYMSTVSSRVYKVSDGYVSNQQIRGVKTGETVTQFLANIIKKNDDQVLTVTSHSDGSELAEDALVSLNDILTVISADSTNTTKYVLEVSVDGLNSDAGLSSSVYTVSIDVQPSVSEGTPVAGSGTVSGFDYTTLLKTLVSNLTPAQGATMSIIDQNGGYASFRKANFDSTYVDVTVNTQMYIEVLAEDGLTMINYSLEPEASESAAFVVSFVYTVIQNDFLIQLVPRGSSTRAFLSNLIPVSGATLKVIDKMGFERMDGQLADDDKLVVTSADGTVSNVYHIAMLPTETITGVFYLAYILSDVYSIDQVEYVIHNVPIVDIAQFNTRIRPVAGATAVVVDANGAVKTSGNIMASDMVKVTSFDGKIEVMYTFALGTGTESMEFQSQLEFFPNPTRGDLNLLGAEPGQRITVYNFNGASVLDIDVRSNVQVIPLQNLPAGMYMIVVSKKDGQRLGVFKAIKSN